MHIAKTDPILSPLRDTLLMGPPACSSLARSSRTSQARACSKLSSSRKHQSNRLKYVDFQAGNMHAQLGWPQHPHTALCLLRWDAATAPAWPDSHPEMLISSVSGARGNVASWDPSARREAAFPGLCNSRTVELYSWQGMETVLGAPSHTQAELLWYRAGWEGGYFDRVLLPMKVNRRTIKSCASASTGNC